MEILRESEAMLQSAHGLRERFQSIAERSSNVLKILEELQEEYFPTHMSHC